MNMNIWIYDSTGYNTDTIKKNTGTVIDASKEVGLEVNTEKTKYMLLSRHQNADQSHDMKVANTAFENMAQLRYFGTTRTITIKTGFRRKLWGIYLG
jgi:hypothetical protein